MRVVGTYLSDLNTPISLQAKACLESGDVVGYLDLRVDPSSYTTAESFYRDYQAVNLLKKCADLKIGSIDPKAAAIEAWWKAEAACARTNRLFKRVLSGADWDASLDGLERYVLRPVRDEFRKIMGAAPVNLDMARFGPGSTLRDRGLLATVPDKMTSRPTVSPGSRCLLDTVWCKTAWFRALCQDRPNATDPETLYYDEYLSVRKNAKTERGIAIGPSINTYYQLGVGSFIRRRRFDRIGLVLESAQDLHRKVAMSASKTGEFCTVDLTSASDMKARLMIRYLCPDDWWLLLNSLRVTHTLVPTGIDSPGSAPVKVKQYLHKFSAMGNGFTFELETAVFLAIAMTACRVCGVEPIVSKNVFVYGDDIICPTDVGPTLLRLLRIFGFQPNYSKTFLSGKFRESCGGDYFDGQAVRPYQLKEFPREPQEWIALANGLRRASEASASVASRWLDTRRAWMRALDQIPVHIRRCRGPVALGDLVIHDEPEFWQTMRHESNPWIRLVRVWKPVSKPLPFHHWTANVQLASALYGVPSDGPLSRGSVEGYRLDWVPFS